MTHCTVDAKHLLVMLVESGCYGSKLPVDTKSIFHGNNKLAYTIYKCFMGTASVLCLHCMTKTGNTHSIIF